MKKEYTIKRPDKRRLKKYWDKLELLESIFYHGVELIEKDMQKETNIKDIEFFWADNEIVGIGTGARTVELIHRDYE